jgi:hypothetical protein
MANTTSESTSGGEDKPGFAFTLLWFMFTAKSVWEKLIPQIKPTTILEVGPQEVAGACYRTPKIGQRL